MICWRGDKEIPADGGTVVWKPVIDDTRLIPTFVAGYLEFYDSNDDWSTVTLDIDSLKIEKAGYEKIQGEWYEVVASMNAVSITLSSNDTPFKRGIVIDIDDGQGKGGQAVMASQSPESWNQE